MAGQTTLSRRRLLALSAAGAVALPSGAAAHDLPSPLGALIERHKTAAAALDDACARLDQAGQDVASKYPAELCRAWLSEPSSRREWPKVRKAHGIEGLEGERQRLDAAEKAIALEVLAYPCRDLAEVRMKAAYVRKADILIESLMRDERHIEALLASLAG